MAVAVKLDQGTTQEKGKFNISAEKYWCETLRPMLDEMSDGMTDVELSRTARKMINAVDTKIANKNGTQDILDEIMPTLSVLSADTYFIVGPLKRASEAEKEKVRTLKDKLNDFRIILKMDEKPAEQKENDIKERLNYKPSNEDEIGSNKDFLEHNMAKLNEPSPRPRIPNTDDI